MISPTVDRFANRELMECVIQDYATKKVVENLDYANVVTSYESDSIYLDWVNGTYTWTRPDAPKNN